LTPVILDVADQATIDAAAKQVVDAIGDEGLNGLVNNAGITVQGPLEHLPLDDLRHQFEVNVIGQVAVTQAFLPPLRVARGRIVNVGSIAGRAPALPFIGPYGASKWAIEAISDALRVELEPAGIKVVLIEPGNIATPIWEKGLVDFDRMVAALPEEGRSFYGKRMAVGQKLAQWSGAHGIPAEKVAERIRHALESSRPRTRYLVGMDARVQAYLTKPVPTAVRDRLLKRVLDRKS
jgi:NAD(P)-dependent dehydrogenase (short-subunit alcohol dehydrogenase family)